MCPFLLELLLQVHSRAFFLIWQKTKKLVLKQASPWLILLKLNILLEPTTQTTSHGIIPEIEEEVAATGIYILGSSRAQDSSLIKRTRKGCHSV